MGAKASMTYLQNTFRIMDDRLLTPLKFWYAIFIFIF